jgi:hypothetical protein
VVAIRSIHSDPNSQLARSATQLAGLPIASALREFLGGAPDGDLRVALAAEPMNTPFFINTVRLSAYLQRLQPFCSVETNMKLFNCMS